MLKNTKPSLYIFSVFLFLMAVSTLSTAQTNNGIRIIDKTGHFATYNYEYQEDSTSTDSRKQGQMWLLIGENISQFTHTTIFKLDSMLYECSDIKNPTNIQKIGLQLTGDPYSFLTQYTITKNKNSIQTDLYEIISGKFYHIPEKITFNWQLINSKDTLIAGYRCKEARTSFRGRRYKAWYTTDIPINDGPYKFRGLPGLIVKVEDTQKQHCFELESFTKAHYKKPIYLWDEKFVQIKARQYPRIKHNEALDRVRKYGSRVVNISPEKQGNIEAKILRRNNLIEKSF